MIENIVYQALKQMEIAQSVATYNDEPAVFYQNAPNDQDYRWSGKQYPRINYDVLWSFNPERNTAGTLSIDVWCLNSGDIPPEECANAIKNELSGMFFSDEGGIFCALWSRTDPFEGTGVNEPKTIGATITFDIVEFPKQYSIAPDPIKGVNEWVKQTLPNTMIIGEDELPSIWKPTDETPAFYCRTTGNLSRMQNTYAVATMQATITGHLIATSSHGQQQWLKILVEKLSIAGEVILDGGTPMIITGLSFGTSPNPVQQGQLSITGEYRVMVVEPEEPRLEHIYTREG